MKIYIASRFSRRHECHALGKELEAYGHEIVSRWTKPDSDHVVPVGMSQQAADVERERFAVEDLEDVDKCDCIVSLMEENPRSNTRGGRHVEFGYAAGKGKELVVIGCRETVFHHLPDVAHFDSADDYICAVEDMSTASYSSVDCATRQRPSSVS